MNTWRPARHHALILVALISFLSGCAATPSAGGDTKNAALVSSLDQWAVAWSSGDVETLLPLFVDDVVYEDVAFAAVNNGKEALGKFAMDAFGAFPGMCFEIKSRLVAGDGRWGALEWVWRGRQAKDLPGLPATNTSFEVRGASIVEFRDGKISRCSDYWDLSAYLKQVGLAK